MPSADDRRLSVYVPTNLWLKVAFRPLFEGASLFKADFVGSVPFAGYGTKTFLSADAPYEGFHGNFSLMNGYGDISLLNGTIIFEGELTLGDPTDMYNPSYRLRAMVLTWGEP